MTHGLKDKLVFDRFTNNFLKTDFMPWDFARKQKITSWTDKDDDCLINYLDRNPYNIRVPQILKTSLSELAEKKSTNVVTDYFRQLIWDGIPRIDTLLIDYFGTEDTIYSREIIRKELVAAVTRAIEERPVKFDQMIILTGPQGIGKSTFLNKLGKKWYTDFKLKLDDKDTLVTLQKYMIVEVGELAGFNRVEVTALKNFMSQATDTFRAPYDRRAVEHPRHYVLFGTTNDDEFLKDSTGERRFWPIECLVQKATKSVFDDLNECEVDQIWAEAVQLYDGGESLELSAEAKILAKEHQEMHKVVHPWEGLISEFILEKVTKNWLMKTEFADYSSSTTENADLVDKDRICAAIIWCECLGNGTTKNMRQSDSNLINGILGALKFEDRILIREKMRFGKYGSQRGFKIKKKVDKVDTRDNQIGQVSTSVSTTK